jgi:isoleucyl-tRNA synthetase
VEGLGDVRRAYPAPPYVDAVKLACPQCGGQMSRVPDVGNPWLDAGHRPVQHAQLPHRPGLLAQVVPGEWITESFPGQFRNWFYSLLAMATVLDHSPPFLREFWLCHPGGRRWPPDAQKLGQLDRVQRSRRQDGRGCDALAVCTHKPENDLLFGYHRGDEARRQFLIPLWNAYSFFVTYANLDGWTPRRL